MGVEAARAEPARYRAFISYSHGDAKFAHWLHRKLESWRLPDNSRLTPVFIDRAELAAGSDLSAQVREALEQSAALVVVCSPNARASRWVGQEIALFRALHPDRPVLAALIDGEPGAAFPEPLLGTGEAPLEPLAADFRKGHDGKRLGLLKLAAGLTKLPLDRLVQRDAAARQRRVMAITAAALALVLILSAALVIALRARAEAERQRAEAEGLVEFMLTDLRDKLEGVGSLEVMDTVNQRAMEHYQGEDLSGLPREIVLRQAKLLQRMAEVDLSSTANRARGIAAARQALRLTEQLFAIDPDDSEIVFQHAQSEYWVGYGAFLSRGQVTSRDLVGAEAHWQRYRKLAHRLAQLEGSSNRAIKEAVFAEGNLCTLMLEMRRDLAGAVAYCHNSRIQAERLLGLAPDKPSEAIELANRLSWEAEALQAAGNLAGALKLRERQLALIQARLQGARSTDYSLIEAHLLALMGLVKTLIALGDFEKANAQLSRASQIANELVRRDPINQDWLMWRAMVNKEKKEIENVR